MRAPLLALALLGCSSAAQAPAVVTLSLGSEEEGADDLWARLAAEKVEGLALVWSDAVLHPSAAAARQATTRPRTEGPGVSAVQVLEDLGDVVKVRTWLSPRVRPGMTPLTDYDLTVYAAREQLVPAVREDLAKSFADGTGYVVRVGMPVALGERISPIDRLGGMLDVEIPPSAVGLSFPLRGDSASVDGKLGEELACERKRRPQRRDSWMIEPIEEIDEEERTIVITADEEREKRAAERRERLERERERRREDDGPMAPVGLDMGSYGMGLQEQATCSLVSRWEPKEKGYRATVNGKFFARVRDVGGDRCSYAVRVFRAPADGQVLLDVDVGRAAVRVSVPQGALRTVGGCGAIGGLGLRGRGRGKAPPPPPKVLAAKGKVKVTFPDGTLAGYHMRGVTKMRKATRTGDRLCIEHDHVSTRLCFSREDLVEVDD